MIFFGFATKIGPTEVLAGKTSFFKMPPEIRISRGATFSAQETYEKFDAKFINISFLRVPARVRQI